MGTGPIALPQSTVPPENLAAKYTVAPENAVPLNPAVPPENVVVGSVLDGWDVADLTVESAVAVPVDPLGGGEFDLGKCLSGPAGFDQLGLEQADRRFHQGVVVGVADRAD